jgi:nitrate reductase cytochrome c-type subunit
MKSVVRFLAITALLQFLFAPCAAFGGEQAPTEKEVMQAEDEPPVIPHRVSDDATFKECLKCHETGKQGAPATFHPERRNCTQCHIAGFVKDKTGKKGKKKK